MQSIVKKSYAFVAAAALIISVYFIAGVLIFANNQYNDINTGNLIEAARTLQSFTPAAVFSDADASAEWVVHFGETTSSYHRITLISRSGQVIFDTNVDSAAMENHLDRHEFQAAVRNGTGSARRRSTTLGQYHLYAAVAIHNAAGELAGVLRLSRMMPGFFTRLLSSTLPFFAGGLLIIIGACAGLYYVSRRLSLSVEEKLDSELKKKTAELVIKAEEAQAESRHREVILNSMFDGVITLDSSLNIIHANSRFCFLFDISAGKNVCGMSLIEFSRSVELEEAARQVLLTGRPYELTLKRHLSGVRQYFQVFASPLDTVAANGTGGKIRGVVMVLGDISRLVKLERIRKDFAANVSHELRTPIQVIQGFAENILASSPKTHEQIYRFAGIIRKNALGMENLINDLLTLVSLEDEDASRPPMEVSVLAPLIAEAVDMVAIAAQKKNITIAVSCPPDLTAPLYSSLFIQAMINLLDNSIKYSGDASPVTVNVFQEENVLVVEVKDKGIGIPAEHIDRIFERFYRTDRSRSREEGGTGLGLSIVRHIAMLHRGTVEVTSHAGDGSVFRLRLSA